MLANVVGVVLLMLLMVVVPDGVSVIVNFRWPPDSMSNIFSRLTVGEPAGQTIQGSLPETTAQA